MKKKILIIKWGAIGDVVMTFPMVKYLKNSLPNCSISWVAGNTVKDLIIQTSLADKVISFDENKLFNKGPISKIYTLSKIWRIIGFRRFDTIYILHKDSRYLAISFFSFGKKIRLMDGKNFFPKIYHAKQLLSLVNPHSPVIYPKLYLPLKDSFVHLFDKRPVILLSPGGASNILNAISLKRWPIENYVHLGKILLEKGFSVFLIGNQKDEWVSQYFISLPIKNLIGKTTLLDLLGLYNRAQYLITHDTGVMHLAKLTNLSVIALFGPTNPQEFIEDEKQIQTLWGGKNLFCRPCYDGKNFPECRSNKCLQQISVQDVLDKFQSLNHFP